MILRRLVTADCIDFGIVWMSRRTPSTRARTRTEFFCGLKWTSDAPRSIASREDPVDLADRRGARGRLLEVDDVRSLGEGILEIVVDARRRARSPARRRA